MDPNRPTLGRTNSFWHLMALSGILAAALSPGVNALWLGDCTNALGMESGSISDESITASSSHDNVVGPQNARVRVENRGGAWCPKGQLRPEGREFLEIDLGHLHVITETGSQGRFGNGDGREYTEFYQLEYWRPGFPDFELYVDAYGNKTLPGNSNTYLEVRTKLLPPVIASKIRFVPFVTHPRTICLRVEVYGCNHTTGLLNYTALEGSIKEPVFRPDGGFKEWVAVRGGASGGLGLLYDGEVGPSLTHPGLTGFEKGWGWLGWSNSPVEAIFYFDDMRNFSNFSFFIFEAPEDGFVVPSQVEAFFGENGLSYQEKPLRATFESSATPGGRNLTFSLQQRPAKVLKVLFHFPEGSFVCSEVYFASDPCSCSLSDWWPPSEASAPAERTADRKDRHSGDISTVSAMYSYTHTTMGVVIGFVVGVFLLVASGLLVYVRRLRQRKSSPHSLKTPLSDSGSVTFDMRSLRLTTSYSGGGVSMYGPISIQEDDGSLYHEPYKSHPFSVSTIGRHFNELAVSPEDYAIPVLSTPPGLFAGGSYNSTANTPYNTTPLSIPSTPFCPPPILGTPQSDSTNFRSDSNITLSSDGVTRFPSMLMAAPPETHQPHFTPPQIAKDLETLSPFGTALYQSRVGGCAIRSRPPREVPRHLVHLGDKLGDGEFGTVYVGELAAANDSKDVHVTTASSMTSSLRKVLVAALNDGAPEDQRNIAWGQAQILASLQDPNIECLLGVVSDQAPLLLVLEHPTLGDLNQYLRKHVPDTTTPRLTHMRTISYGSLIYLATQIASGMKYLESYEITHRDLATRNILVAPGQLVKIGSVGACRSLYAGDYYRHPPGDVSPRRLPIRWMSWEALFMDEFSGKSDVWSFGITLWEILTLARQQPFEKMSDDGVIENLAHIWRHDGEGTVPPQPAMCPKEIYDLLLECWKRDASERPNFRDIHMFLQRKNHGYSPDL